MRIKKFLEDLEKYAAVVVVFVAVYGFIFILPLVLPAIVATRIRSTPLVFVVFSALLYVIIWVAALFTLMDSAAYVYGFRRPFVAARPSTNWFHLGVSTVRKPFGFVKTSLVSYALTLYGFSILYTLISHLNSEAFNVNRPLDIFTSIYFTISTAATVGYGDISPASPTARLIVTVEIIFSFLYLVLIFSTFAGLARLRIAEKRK